MTNILPIAIGNSIYYNLQNDLFDSFILYASFDLSDSFDPFNLVLSQLLCHNIPNFFFQFSSIIH